MPADKDSHKGSSAGAGRAGANSSRGQGGAGGFESRAGQGNGQSRSSQSSRAGNGSASAPSGARGSQPSRGTGGLAGAAGLSRNVSDGIGRTAGPSRSISRAAGRTVGSGGITSGNAALGATRALESTTRQFAGRTASTGGVAARQPARGSTQQVTQAAGKTAGSGGLAKAARLGNYESTVPNVSGDTRFNLRDNEDRRMVRATQASPQVSFRQTEEVAQAKYDARQDFLALLRRAEGNYNSVGFASSWGKPTRADLPNMTLREVHDWQEAQDNSKGKTYKADRTYAGAYQIGKDALKNAMKYTGLGWDAKFTRANQDQLAMGLARMRAQQVTPKKGTANPDDFAQRIAMEWAGVASNNGASYYDGIAGNKASVSHDKVKEVARNLLGTGAIPGGDVTQTRAVGRKVPDPGRRTRGAGLPSGEDAPIPTARPKQSAQERMKMYLSREGLADAEAARKVLASGPVDWDTAKDLIAVDRARKGYPWKEVPVPAEFVREQVPMQAPVQDSQRVVPTGSEPVAPQRETAAAAPVTPVDNGTVPTTTPIAPVRRAASPSLAPTQDQSIAPVAPIEVAAPIDDTRPAKKAPTTGEKLVAGGIDVGLGLVPGIGVAASIFNGVATLAGGPTLGEAAVDLFGGRLGDNAYRPGPMDRERSSARTVLEEPQAARTDGQSETMRTRIRRKYLRPPEPYRPTPTERWGDINSLARV